MSALLLAAGFGYYTLCTFFVIICILLIFMVVITPSSEGGMAATFAGMGGDSFFGTKAHQSINKFTVFLAVSFLVLAFWINWINKTPAAAAEGPERHRGKDQEPAPAESQGARGGAHPAAQMNSMTGFGSASSRDRRMDIDVEVRSVNHRFLTLKQSLPDALARYEGEIEQMVRSRLGRGSVTVTVSVKTPRDREPSLPDVATFKAYAKQLKDVQKALGLKGDVRMEDLLAIPSIWSNGATESSEELWPKVKKLLPKALDGLVEAREREGGKIADALESHLGTIEGRLGKVQSRVPQVVEAYQKRLDDRIQQLLTQRGLEAAKLDIVKEVAVHADRCDTSEEIQRLRSHIGEFRKIVAQKGQVGRRLDFMTQEMGRETNTIASKANDGEIAASAVEMKAELEKIKEQVENVE